uniref:Uncharacterized protein n=1 Tax=Arundo donax TaxID=35708 RepID=A0A0A9HQW8_ARUDO
MPAALLCLTVHLLTASTPIGLFIHICFRKKRGRISNRLTAQ